VLGDALNRAIYVGPLSIIVSTSPSPPYPIPFGMYTLIYDDFGPRALLTIL